MNPGSSGWLDGQRGMWFVRYAPFAAIRGDHGNLLYGLVIGDTTGSCPRGMARARHGGVTLTCAQRLDVAEFPAGSGHNCGAPSVTGRRM